MRLFLAVAAVAAAMFTATAASAHASSSWPATCRTMRCVNGHLNDLDTRVRAQHSSLVNVNQQLQSEVSNLQSQVNSLQNQNQSLASKLGCISSLKMWQQYTYDVNSNFFTYMDLTRNYGVGTYNGPYYVLQDTCGIF